MQFWRFNTIKGDYNCFVTNAVHQMTELHFNPGSAPEQITFWGYTTMEIGVSLSII